MGHMSILCLLLAVLLVLLCDVSSATSTVSQNADIRDSKYFHLMAIVRFQNKECTTTSGNSGTCYTSQQCSKNGGVADGKCASGVGVCCYMTGSCGVTSTTNATYFTSPGYDGAYTTEQTCTFTIEKLDNVCQYRLEFEDFELNGPTNTGATTDIGKCEGDQFSVEMLDYEDFGIICGYNTGQHLQLDVSDHSQSVIKVVTSGSGNRKWKIKVIQVLCDSSLRAPPGCHQFHVGHSGLIQSFNYNPTDSANSLHLQNQKQVICIRPEHGFCFIDYNYNTGVTESDAFSVSEATTDLHSAYPCDTDYLIVPGGRDSDLIHTVDRFCGEGLKVTDVAGADKPATVRPGLGEPPIRGEIRPFQAIFISDGEDDIAAQSDTNGKKGFSLEFKQRTCGEF